MLIVYLVSCPLCLQLMFKQVNSDTFTSTESVWANDDGDDKQTVAFETRAVATKVTLNTTAIADWLTQHMDWKCAVAFHLWLMYRAVSLFHWPLQLPSFYLSFFFFVSSPLELFRQHCYIYFFSTGNQWLDQNFYTSIAWSSLVRFSPVTVECFFILDHFLPSSISFSPSFVSFFFLSHEVLVTVHCDWSLNPTNPGVFSSLSRPQRKISG